MEEGRGIGFWLLVVGWVLLIVPGLVLAAWVAMPAAWRSELGDVRTASSLPSVARGRLPPLTEALGSGEIAETLPAWRRHRQPPPAVAAATPLIAFVVADLGDDETLLSVAVALPGAVTLSFDPIAEDFDLAVVTAFTAGHELLIDLPMEEGGGFTPGPEALLLRLSAERNVARLDRLLDGPAAPGETAEKGTAPLVGVVALEGAAFLSAVELSAPVMAALAERGLIFLDAVPGADAPATPDLPRLPADGLLGGDPEAFAHRLAELERAALLQGAAVGVLPAGDGTLLARVRPWLATLEARGYALAPLTAVLERRRTLEAEREAGSP